jgi:hypothetical protein
LLPALICFLDFPLGSFGFLDQFLDFFLFELVNIIFWLVFGLAGSLDFCNHQILWPCFTHYKILAMYEDYPWGDHLLFYFWPAISPWVLPTVVLLEILLDPLNLAYNI